jgi:hypothetical protein
METFLQLIEERAPERFFALVEGRGFHQGGGDVAGLAGLDAHHVEGDAGRGDLGDTADFGGERIPVAGHGDADHGMRRLGGIREGDLDQMGRHHILVLGETGLERIHQVVRIDGRLADQDLGGRRDLDGLWLARV